LVKMKNVLFLIYRFIAIFLIKVNLNDCFKFWIKIKLKDDLSD
jgi:hypothetical protein